MKGLTIQQPQQHAVEDNISNLTSASCEAASVSSSGNRNDINGEGMYPQHYFGPTSQTQSQPPKKKRNLPGNPDPDAEVIAMSPKSLLATNRFVCDICNKGFQRDQNLQLHRRGHNLPWKLKQRTSKEIKKKVYVCPETSCVHHDPSRALGDLTGIKKHFCRKHGEKKWKCDKCSKRYAVRSDLKAHSKTCGTKEYRCDCGTLFSRRDSFVSHKSLCDVLAEEGARAITGINANQLFSSQAGSSSTSHMNLQVQIPQFDSHEMHPFSLKKEPHNFDLRPEVPPWLQGGAGPGPGPGPSPPFDILSSSIFPTRLNRDISAGHETFQPESMCPLRSVIPKNTRNPNPSLGPSLLPAYHPTPTPQISATALLQKAAMVGATMNSNKTSSSAAAGAMLQQQGPHQAHHVSADSCNNKTTSFGLNLSSREDLATDQFVNNLASYGNKAAGDDGPPRTLFQEMMTSLTPSGFHGSTFNLHETLSRTTTSHDQFIKVDEAAANGGNGGNDGLTRDFLGLRTLSHSDIFNIAGLNSYMNSSSSDQQHHNRNQKPWQV